MTTVRYCTVGEMEIGVYSIRNVQRLAKAINKMLVSDVS